MASGFLVYQGLTHCCPAGHFLIHGRLHLSSASFYWMGYQLLVGLLTGLLLVRKKQQQVELLDEQKQHLLRTYTLSVRQGDGVVEQLVAQRQAILASAGA